jgi:hypothetical protein
LWLLYGESRPWRKERNRIRKVQPEVAASLDVSVSPQAVEQRFGVDAGYFTLLQMRAHGQAGCFWLTTAKAGTLLIDERGQCWDLVSLLGAQRGEEVDVPVLLGKGQRLPSSSLTPPGIPPPAYRLSSASPGCLVCYAVFHTRSRSAARWPSK